MNRATYCDFDDYLKAIADETRQRILLLLQVDEMSESHIVAHLELTQPTISHHLFLLRRANLISARRKEKYVFYCYCANPACLAECCSEILNRFKMPSAKIAPQFFNSLADELEQDINSVLKKLRAARDLMRLPSWLERPPSRRGPATLKGKRHAIERDRQAVTYPSNASNDFYALFLGKNLVYSCAYFQTPDEALDIVQERKLDYICRKLRLRPGQRMLDIGCGWGGLVIYAARHYGVDATGITLSQPQADLANTRIAEAGLTDRCRVLVRDYREVNEAGGYDFDVGRLNLHQALLIRPSKDGRSGLPLTRADWYVM